MYFISIYFDQQTNQTLQRYITQIGEKTGNTFMTEHRVPPNMTFASVGQLLPYVFYVTPRKRTVTWKEH